MSSGYYEAAGITVEATLMSDIAAPDRRDYRVRKSTLAEQDLDADLDGTTAAERIGMMWQLALDAWAFKGRPVAEPGLPRHTWRVRKRRC